MKNIVFNEDCNHFLYTRENGGLKELHREDIVAFIMQYKDLGIETVIFDLGAPLAWYHSRRHRSIIELYPEWHARSGKRLPYVEMLLDFYKREGTDVQTVFFETARKAGLKPFISLRMCDVHEGYMDDSFLWSDFYRENKTDKCIVPHRTPAGYFDYCLNYHFEEVREHYLSLLEEALETFDAEGVELDFLREATLFGYGKEHEGLAVMNAFMREVHARVKEAEKKWGHSLALSVRLPATPEMALRFGFDFFDWIDAGLIDRIAISSRWATTDTGMPVDLWHKLLRGKNVKLAAGLELLLRGYDRTPVMPHSYETAIGTAAAFLSQGADEIYLFNFFDHYNGFSNFIYFGKDADLYHRFLTVAGDYETVIHEPRRHVLSYNDMTAVGVASPRPLPVTLSNDRSVKGPFHSNILYNRFRIVTGKIPAGRRVKVVLGFAKSTEYDVRDLTVYLNQAPCAYVGTEAPKAPQYDDLDYLVFEAENDGTLPDVSVVELGFAHGNTTLGWVEIEIP